MEQKLDSGTRTLAGRSDLPVQLIQAELVSCLALPDEKRCPSQLLDGLLIMLVPGNIAVELVLPELAARPRCRRIPAGRMSVPEASMDKDSDAVDWQHEIRTARQTTVMQQEPQPSSMQVASDPKLRLSVLSTDA